MNVGLSFTYDSCQNLSSRGAKLASTCAVSYGSYLKTSFRYFWKVQSCCSIIKAASYRKVEAQQFSFEAVFLSSLKHSIFCLL